MGLLITVGVENIGHKSKPLFISTYLNPFLVHSFSENAENRWFREVRFIGNETYEKSGCFVIRINEDLSRTASVSNYGIVTRNIEPGEKSSLIREETTTSRYQYVGGSRGSLH